MQEKTRGLFVAATANRIDLLPAEMIRKGRFDEVFFVDLPVEEERIEIFKIHLTRRGLDASRMNLETTDGVHDRLDGRGDRAVRGFGDHESAAGESRGHGTGSGEDGCEYRAFVADDEGADQSYSGLGV